MYKLIMIVVIIVFAFFSVFILPYSFPLRHQIDSASYQFGFNNIVAIVGVIIAVLAIVAIIMWRHAAENIPSFKLFVFKNNIGFSWKTKIFFVCAIIYILISIFSFFVYDSPNFHGEEEQFVKSINLLQLGKIPYKDFWFPFGPALIYVPFLMKIALSSFGASSRSSYYLFFGIIYFLSGCILYYLINNLDIDQRKRNFVFAVMALLSLNLGVAVQYTFIRCLPPFFFLLVFHKYLTSNLGSRSILKNLGIIVLPLLFLAIVASLFFEVGIAFFAVLLCYLVIFLFVEKNNKILIPLGFLAALPFLFVLFVPKEAFKDILDYLAGGNNFPIFPSFPVLIFLFSVFYSIPVLFKNLVGARKTDISFYVSYALLCLFLILGAFGRSDSGHLFYYGIGVFILTAALLAKTSNKGFKAYLAVFTVIFGLSLLLGTFAVMSGKIASSLYSKCGKYIFHEKDIVKYAAKLGFNEKKTLKIIEYEKNDPSVAFGALKKYRSLMAPMVIDNKLYDYLLSSGKYVPEYYLYMVNVNTEKELEKKIADLCQSENLIISKFDMDGLKAVTDDSSTNKNLSMVLSFPIMIRPRNAALDLNRKFLIYIRSNYRIVEEFGQYLIYQRKQPAKLTKKI